MTIFCPLIGCRCRASVHLLRPHKGNRRMTRKSTKSHADKPLRDIPLTSLGDLQTEGVPNDTTTGSTSAATGATEGVARRSPSADTLATSSTSEHNNDDTKTAASVTTRSESEVSEVELDVKDAVAPTSDASSSTSLSINEHDHDGHDEQLEQRLALARLTSSEGVPVAIQAVELPTFNCGLTPIEVTINHPPVSLHLHTPLVRASMMIWSAMIVCSIGWLI
jgi:hypothetical protein